MTSPEEARTIIGAAPQIFRRPLLFVGPKDPMLQVATFLAIGPQIYADGLVVLEGDRLAGRIGGYALACHILDAREGWLDARAEDIMDPLERPVQSGDPVKAALDIFRETKFAFVPVAHGGKVVASLSVRDLLGTVTSGEKAALLGSQVVTGNDDTSVLDSLRLMVERGVRNLVFMERDGPYVLNDRKVLEYLLSHDASERSTRHGFEGFETVRAKALEPVRGVQAAAGATAAEAARLLADISTPCIFIDGNRTVVVVTPWDVVMKTAAAAAAAATTSGSQAL